MCGLNGGQEIGHGNRSLTDDGAIDRERQIACRFFHDRRRLIAGRKIGTNDDLILAHAANDKTKRGDAFASSQPIVKGDGITVKRVEFF